MYDRKSTTHTDSPSLKQWVSITLWDSLLAHHRDGAWLRLIWLNLAEVHLVKMVSAEKYYSHDLWGIEKNIQLLKWVIKFVGFR